MKKGLVNARITFAIILLVFFLFIMVNKVYVYYSDPNHDKNLMEYSVLHFRANRKDFLELGEYYTSIKTKYPRFCIVNDFKRGLIWQPIGPFEEDSNFVADTIVKNFDFIKYTDISAPENKQQDFNLTEGDKYLLEKLGITKIVAKTDLSGRRYLQIYTRMFNKLDYKREVILFYFSEGASKQSVIDSYHEFKSSSEVTDRNQGFFVEDKSWIFLIERLR